MGWGWGVQGEIRVRRESRELLTIALNRFCLFAVEVFRASLSRSFNSCSRTKAFLPQDDELLPTAQCT